MRVFMAKKYILYLLRWQLSSVILAPAIYLISNAILAAVIGNFIGGLIFFHIDRWIFKKGEKDMNDKKMR